LADNGVPVEKAPVVNHMTSATTYSDPVRGFGGNYGLEFSHALIVVVESRLAHKITPTPLGPF